MRLEVILLLHRDLLVDDIRLLTKTKNVFEKVRHTGVYLLLSET